MDQHQQLQLGGAAGCQSWSLSSWTSWQLPTSMAGPRTLYNDWDWSIQRPLSVSYYLHQSVQLLLEVQTTRFGKPLDLNFGILSGSVVAHAPLTSVRNLCVGGGSRWFWRRLPFSLGPTSAAVGRYRRWQTPHQEHRLRPSRSRSQVYQQRWQSHPLRWHIR